MLQYIACSYKIRGQKCISNPGIALVGPDLQAPIMPCYNGVLKINAVCTNLREQCWTHMTCINKFAYIKFLNRPIITDLHFFSCENSVGLSSATNPKT